MKKKRKIIILLSFLISILTITSVIFGTVLFESWVTSKASIEANSVDKVIDVNDSTKDNIEIDCSTQSLTFTSAGDYTDINIQINNRTNAIVQYQYEFSFDGSTFKDKTESFASCILVYYNNTFVNTLANLCINSDNKVESGYLDFIGYINKASDNSYSSSTDTIRFELHSAADKSYFDTTNAITFNIKAYARTADFEHFMYVSNVSDFNKAIDDINSGGCPSDVKILLFNNITLTNNYEIMYPVNIDLNGFELIINGTINFMQSGISYISSNKKLSINSLSSSGSIILNNEDGNLVIEDFKNNNGINIGYLYSNLTSVTKCNTDVMYDLVIKRAKLNLRYGIEQNSSINLFSSLSFYNVNAVAGTKLTYTNPNLITDNINYSVNSKITINNQDIAVKILGTADDTLFNLLLTDELAYLVHLSETSENGVIINTNAADLFLPTSIKNKNITINWQSSDEELMSNSGTISKDISGNQVVSLYATIKINDSVYTKTFTIRIMSQNHETIFQYFIAQLSPITIEVMYNGTNSTEAYYFLPIVDSNYDVNNNQSYVGYDYRSSYSTPQNIATGDSGYNWEAFANVGFEYLNYSLISTYNFISLAQNATDSNNLSGVAVYLDQATFQTYAQINVSTKFAGDDEVYNGTVNILIDTGYNTELNELVFTKVQGDLDEVDVLQNILDSRLSDNMLNEKGDFYLEGNYQTYYISYQIPTASQDKISEIIGYSVTNDTYTQVASITGSQAFTSAQILSIDLYKVCLNIENFEYNNFDLGINTILVMPTGNSESRASRILYFSCPGVIKCDEQGFSNMSVFNSVKYQVWYELANNITNEVYEGDVRNGDYTLSTDNESFTISNGVVINHTGAYILRHDVSQCSTLAFSLSEGNTNTDNHIVYGLSKIIDWILGDTTDSFSTHFNNNVSFDSSFINTYGSYKSNGYSYIDESEEEVLKNYFLTYVSNNQTTFDTLWNEISYQQQDTDGTYKYVLVNSSEFMQEVRNYYSSSSTYGTNRNEGTVFKFQEVLQWAHNDKDFTPESGYSAGHTPDLGVVGSGEWSNLLTSSYSNWTVTWKQWQNSKYTSSPYLEDNTDYITAYELEVILAMLLNSKGNTNNNVNNASLQFVQNVRDTYFTIPRYLTNDGVSKLIQAAYNLLNKTVSGNANSGFSAELSSFRVCGEVFNTPHVTLLDGSTVGFDYFDSLTILYIYGDTTGKLKAFHSTAQVTNFFNRVTSNNLTLVNLAAEYVSDSNMKFSIETISNLKNLEKIDLYHNQGITNIGALLKTNMENLVYVNVADINLKNEYSEFTLQAINYKSTRNPEVYYSIDGYTSATLYTTVLNSNAEGLIYLEEFYELLAENAQLTQNVYTENNSSVSIQWAIESGNGISFIDTSNASIETLNTVYTKYYLVINSFTYNNVVFKANHLYMVYMDNGYMRFSEVFDSNGNDMTITIGTAPNELTDEEVNQWISDNNLTGQTEIVESEHVLSTGTFSANNITSSSATPSGGTQLRSGNSTTTLYDENNTQLASAQYYSIGTYRTNTRTVTTTWSKYDLTNAIYGIITKYYASYDSSTGLYTVNKCDYNIVKADNYSVKNYEQVTTQNWTGFYICRRTGFIFYSYTFTDIRSAYPTCTKITFGSYTYNLYDNSYLVSSNTGDETLLDTQSYGSVNTKELSDSQILYTALAASSTMYSSIYNALVTRYYTISSSGITYYDNGSSTTPTYNGTYQLQLLSGGGIQYTQMTDTTSVLEARTMYDILTEANSHKNDKYFGLYYHNYFAFSGSSINYKGTYYVQNGVYYLELDNNGNFYWAQDSVTNSQTYETISDLNSSGSITYEDVVYLVGQLDSTYEGKIYYYSGASSGSYTLGKNVWFKVMHNEETGAYELRKFGTISYEYDVCNASNGTYTKNTPTNNSTGLYMICNLMEFMDSNLFSSGASTSTYTYGVGGTRNAVITAIVTDNNGNKYERKFVITVTG